MTREDETKHIKWPWNINSFRIGRNASLDIPILRAQHDPSSLSRTHPGHDVTVMHNRCHDAVHLDLLDVASSALCWCDSSCAYCAVDLI